MTLKDPVTELKFVSTKYQHLLTKLGIYTVQDLLTYFPRKYSDLSETNLIKDIVFEYDPEKEYLIKCRVEDFEMIRLRGGRTLEKARAIDASGYIDCAWFNQEYLKNVFNKNAEFYLLGKAKYIGSSFTFYPTLFEEVKDNKMPVHLARIVPEYALTKGISKKWLRNRIKELTDALNKVEIRDELKEILKQKGNLKDFIKQTHFPEDENFLKTSIDVLSTYELTNIQLKLIEKRKNSKVFSAPGIKKTKAKEEVMNFIRSLPFILTDDQSKVIESIIERIESEELINELIQGDVGTGKTIIAIASCLEMVLNGYQCVILAPTTILASQHYKTFSLLLEKFNLNIQLVIGSNKKTEKGDILIGTSAVLARKLDLIKNVGLIIVDEQHRFGVKQREELLEPFKDKLKNDSYPHFINMTATPIPRTIAESFFGNISVSEIKTKPKNRKPIQTRVVPSDKRESCITWIREKILKEKEQVYWVCPLIEESEKLDIKAAQMVFSELRHSLKNVRIGLLHGKMKAKQKEEIMQDFKEGKLDILVSTTVIEVGIDVSNATIMVIENAERFGLAQLHQIRGRVGRGEKESWCFIFTAEESNKVGYNRLQFFADNTDGMEIAKFDLKTRGPGEVYGTLQSGLPNLRIANINDLETIKKSKELAYKLYDKSIKYIELFEC